MSLILEKIWFQDFDTRFVLGALWELENSHKWPRFCCCTEIGPCGNNANQWPQAIILVTLVTTWCKTLSHRTISWVSFGLVRAVANKDSSLSSGRTQGGMARMSFNPVQWQHLVIEVLPKKAFVCNECISVKLLIMVIITIKSLCYWFKI